VDELIRLGLQARLPEDSAVWTEVLYLYHHGKQDHLDYVRYRRRDLPLGSGAIEIAIRRVVNLRLKGNSIYWEEDNAEAMFMLRGLVLSGWWNEAFAKISQSITADRRLRWQWSSPDMPAELKAAVTITLPMPQPEAIQDSYAAAA
jgi:hypothetical protein